MPIPVALFTDSAGFAYNPEDISFGEAESKDIFINRGGNVNKVSIVKHSVTYKLKGAIDTDLAAFELARENGVVGLITGAVPLANIVFPGRTIYSALLVKVTPSAPITVGGVTIYETVDLEYHSQVFN